MIGNRFLAQKLTGQGPANTASKLTSFFQNNVSLPSLGQSGRTFTVQKGALAKKAEPTRKKATQEKKSSEIIEPQGPEEKPSEENDEPHS